MATLLLIGSSVINGIVLATLWGWFVAPTFGVAYLGLAQAIGLNIVFGFLTTHLATRYELPNAEKPQLWDPFLRGAVVLGAGFIVKLFI